MKTKSRGEHGRSLWWRKVSEEAALNGNSSRGGVCVQEDVGTSESGGEEVRMDEITGKLRDDGYCARHNCAWRESGLSWGW